MKRIISNLIYTDTFEGYKHALGVFNSKKDLIITDNVFLFNDPKTNNNLIDMSSQISQKQGIEISQNVLNMCDKIERIFIQNNYKDKFNYNTNKIAVYMPLKSLVYDIIKKSKMISYYTERFTVKKITFIINKSEYFDPLNPWVIPRFSNIYKFLALKGFFGNIFNEVIELNIHLPKNINDTIEKNFLLRILIWPKSYILYRFLKYLKIFLLFKKKIFYAHNCESLSEAIPFLSLGGYQVKPIQFLESLLRNDKIDNKVKNILQKHLDQILLKYLSLYSKSTRQLNAQKEILIDHILLGLSKHSQNSRELENFFHKNKNDLNCIISAGFYGPIAHQLFFLCKKYNILLIGFEHGVTAGINHSTSQFLKYSESTTCHTLLVATKAAKKEFDKANNYDNESKSNNVFIIGEAEQKKRVPFYKFQRHIIRNRYKIHKKDDVVMHVSGILYEGNLKNSIDSPVDSYAFSRESNLLNKVYNNLNKKVLFKKYPSQRMLYQPCYSDIMELSSNISMIDNEDFRYVRAAADIIVTDSNFSTLSWCVMNNIPLVYLHSSLCHKLLSKNIEKLFKNSFLIVNLDKKGWQNELKLLLNLPKKDLLCQWNKKQNNRSLLLDEYILGPKVNSSRESSKHIKKLIISRNKTV